MRQLQSLVSCSRVWLSIYTLGASPQHTWGPADVWKLRKSFLDASGGGWQGRGRHSRASAQLAESVPGKQQRESWLCDSFCSKLFNCFFQRPIKMEVPVKGGSYNNCDLFGQWKKCFRLRKNAEYGIVSSDGLIKCAHYNIWFKKYLD